MSNRFLRLRKKVADYPEQNSSITVNAKEFKHLHLYDKLKALKPFDQESFYMMLVIGLTKYEIELVDNFGDAIFD